MRIKTYAICIYIVLVYWISSHIPFMHTLFFPTLGAFSLLFISRPFEKAEVGKIAFGAVVSSLVGSLLVNWDSGVLSMLVTLIIVIGLINKFKWNAPPILAVALIPFFTQPPMIWAIPLSVTGALAGLLVTLSAAAYFERLLGAVPSLFKRTAKAESDSTL